MKIAFIVHRTNYHKFYGPLIKEALRRSWHVECWLVGDGDGKTYLAPTLENTPKFNGTLENMRLNSIGDAPASEVDAIFSLHPKGKYVGLKTNAKFITLQHGIDSFIDTSPEELGTSDLVCLYSPFWMDWAARYYEARGKTRYSQTMSILEPKVFFAGFPQMDILSEIDTAEVRQRFGIDPDKRVVLFLPITLSNKRGSWPRFFEASTRRKQLSALLHGTRANWRFFFSYAPWFLLGLNDIRLSRAVRRFCNNNDAILIVKGRLKDQLRDWAKEIADISLYDEQVFPPTILELLSIADVCIHFYSFAALESAVTNTFGINIDRPSPAVDFDVPPPAHHTLWRQSEQGSAFNTNGVNRWMSIPDAVRTLPVLRIEDLRMEELDRRLYVERYLSYDDRAASQRLLDRVFKGMNL